MCYIQLNPVRAEIVDSIEVLNTYQWCGHAALVEGNNKSWQACDGLLVHFNKKHKVAIRKYQQFMVDGLDQEERPELVGGGFVARRENMQAVKINLNFLIVGYWAMVNLLSRFYVIRLKTPPPS